MPGQPPSERFKTDVPQVPGVSSRAFSQPGFKPVRLIGSLAVLIFFLVCVRWLMLPKAPATPSFAPTPQIEVPALASEAGAGTSICGVGAKDGVAGAFGSISHRTQTRKNIRTAREPMRRTGLKPGCEKAREETPGTCGTSVLKRSDGGWPGILQYSLDNVRAASTRSLQKRGKADGGRYCRASEGMEQPPTVVGRQRRGLAAFFNPKRQGSYSAGKCY